ncbi:hypothetical protein QTH90_21120 [Variovorax sp. J2P1-59]|uniref:hypothetical protein n=1 Tax=Variovorax flavidus TaxID=3053501 RepID=UPI0025791D90|nr:hypothetical protein [Variovorax sp. J2P1-59]MDM0076924.1 hypothetical protein [Variovorax sp. J2P1-59]
MAPADQWQCMRVRVELRRNQGAWIARFRKQVDLIGELETGRREFDGRSVMFLHLLQMESPNGLPVESPVLYDPKVTDVVDDEIRFLGFERAPPPSRVWTLQQWDVFLLSKRR